MKIKYFLGLIVFLFLVAIGSFTSCKKEKATAAVMTDSIVYRLYSPPLQICTCGGNKYLLDLDFDSVPDIELSLICIDTTIVPFNGCETFSTSFTVFVDTVLNPSLTIQVNSMTYRLKGYSINDSMNTSFSFPGEGSIPVMSYGYGIIPCGQPDTIYSSFNMPLIGSEYFGFAKVVPNGYKYGWLALHFDYDHNLYLDGVAFNNAVNKPILAGQH